MLLPPGNGDFRVVVSHRGGDAKAIHRVSVIEEEPMGSKAKLFGHPIHPMLIPFPIGLLGMAVIFDLLAQFAGQTALGLAAHPMIAAGVITALLAALFGAIDWTGIPGGTRAKTIATIHGLGNVGIVVLFAIAWWLRRENPGEAAGLPLLLEVIGVLALLVTGWLGGELVDRLGVGVDPGANLDAPSSLSGRPAHAAER
jgi:uncharacterized membrane protein